MWKYSYFLQTQCEQCSWVMNTHLHNCSWQPLPLLNLIKYLNEYLLGSNHAPWGKWKEWKMGMYTSSPGKRSSTVNLTCKILLTSSSSSPRRGEERMAVSPCNIAWLLKWKVSGASLVVQWLRLCFQCRGCRFNPWLRNKDPISHTRCVQKKEKIFFLNDRFLLSVKNDDIPKNMKTKLYYTVIYLIKAKVTF